MRKLMIWDLDKTVINSNHRYSTLENGDIDLPFWKENCTPEKIALDTLLPLAVLMAYQYSIKGNMVAICTARVMSPYDWRFLNDNSKYVPFHYAMHRPEGCTTGDAELKKQQILKLVRELNLSPYQFHNHVEVFDDNPTVLKMCDQLGIKSHCSLKLNAQLRATA
jgi:hypothetical protein